MPHHPHRIYLDNAATSWPKPPEVFAAIERYHHELGAPAGRSTYAEATAVEQAVETTRFALAQFLGSDEPRRVIFAYNGTDALNLAIHGLLRDGDHVVTSVVEHNSVLRPLRALEDAGQVQVTRVDCDAAGRIDPGDIQRALTKQTRLVVLTHASNVTGAIQPVADVGRLVRGHGALMLVDAAQTLGHLPVNVEELQADLLAAPGHKGLLGPLGTGLLYVSARAEPLLQSIRQGGTGTQSDEDRQPETLPDKFESGNLNVPGILGLRAGVEFLTRRGIDAVAEHSSQLSERLSAGLAAISGVQIHGPSRACDRVGPLSITVRGYDPQELAAALDAEYRIQVRSGIHCAPLMHRRLGTLQSGGTVRFSVGALNTIEDVDQAVVAVAELAAAATTTA